MNKTSLYVVCVVLAVSVSGIAFLNASRALSSSRFAVQNDACTYYLSPNGSDTNSGTIRTPWQHLQKAFDTLAPGEMACLRAGTYIPAGAFDTPSYRQAFERSGLPDKPIIIRNFPGELAIIHGKTLINGAYLGVEGSTGPGGLVFEGPLGPDSSGLKSKGDAQVAVENSHDIVLNHIEIRDNDYHAGLYVNRARNIQVLGCYIHDNGRFAMYTDPLDGTHPWVVDQGIYWAASSGANRISNCLLEHNRAYNLQLFAGSGTITGLTIVQNTIVKAMNSGVIVGKGAIGNYFANNIVSMNSQEIRNKEIRLADNASNNTLENNIVWNAVPSLRGIDTSDLVRGEQNTVRGLLLTDPLFVNFSSGDYRLQPNSPANGAALASFAERVDHDGMKRTSRPSLGAYER